ncbi:MAG: DUF5752 family protein [Methanocellales archaeon]|nr:DUF5752 family protein [Methanocellales archaeon]
MSKRGKGTARKKLFERILSPVSDTSKGFHFYEALHKPLYQTALSLQDFMEKLKTLPLPSVEFHMSRGDFSKWIADTIGDTKLSRTISKIKAAGEDLRKELIETIRKRITELRKAPAK